MSDIFNLGLFLSAIRLATPLLLAALGGMFSERAGVINIALEGLMLAGAFTAASVTWYAHSPWVGLASAVLAGMAIAGVHAVACIRYRADQVVSGTAINILMLGVPALLSGAFFLSSGSTPQVPKEQLMPYTPIIIAVVLVPLAYYVLYYTPFGLRLRAVGENPEAADAAGVSVNGMRYAAVLISGALAGIGGAYLSIGQSSLFTRNMSAGRGFIALAALIFGKWRPFQTTLACLLFGFTEAFAIQIQGKHYTFNLLGLDVKDWEIPNQFVQILPYVLTIVVLAGFIGTSRAPRALGIPYQKEK
jgi:simple sugar transport system permease protein